MPTSGTAIYLAPSWPKKKVQVQQQEQVRQVQQVLEQHMAQLVGFSHEQV